MKPKAQMGLIKLNGLTFRASSNDGVLVPLAECWRAICPCCTHRFPPPAGVKEGDKAICPVCFSLIEVTPEPVDEAWWDWKCSLDPQPTREKTRKLNDHGGPKREAGA